MYTIKVRRLGCNQRFWLHCWSSTFMACLDPGTNHGTSKSNLCFFSKTGPPFETFGSPMTHPKLVIIHLLGVFSNIKSSKVGHVTMDLMFTILPRSQEHPGKIIGLKSHRYPRIRVTWGTPPRLSITTTWVPSLLLGHVFFFFFSEGDVSSVRNPLLAND